MAIINGTDNDDTLKLTTGNDLVHAGAGSDRIKADANFTAADKVDGDSGDWDELLLDGDYSKQVVFKADTIKHIDKISLAAGHEYSLKLHDGNLDHAQYFYVDAEKATRLVFDGSAEKDTGIGITGSAGDDIIKGSNAGNGFYLEKGGVDTAIGGDGNDSAYFGKTLTVEDSFNGGKGHDGVVLEGDYSQGLTLGANTLVAVEYIGLRPTAQFSDEHYVITTHDNTVSAGATCEVRIDDSNASPSMVFDGSAETDGHFDMRGSRETDVMIGGAQSDRFDIHDGGNDQVTGGDGDDEIHASVSFDTNDFVNGGEGQDTLYLGASAVLSLSNASVQNVETITFEKGWGTHAITASDTLVAAGAKLRVNAGYLDSKVDRVVWNGAGETDGQYEFTGGAGLDVFAGGANDDWFDLRAGGGDNAFGNGGKDAFSLGGDFNTNWRIDGGAGEDHIWLDGDYAKAVTFNSLTLRNVEDVYLDGGHDYSLRLHDATIASGQQLHIGGYYLNPGDRLQIDASADKDGSIRVDAGSAFLTKGSSVIGTSGKNDAVTLSGDYSKGLTFGVKTLMSVEKLDLYGGHSYRLTSNDATVAAGATLEVNGYGLGAQHSMDFDGSAETNGKFVFVTGDGNDKVIGGSGADLFNAVWHAGADTLIGGGGDDTFKLGEGFSADDRIDGGDGIDTVELWNGGSFVLGSANMKDIEAIRFVYPGSYAIKTLDTALGTKEVLRIDGYYMKEDDTLAFNGSAESSGRFDIVSGAGKDKLIGGGGQDYLKSGAGNDVLKGGGNTDRLEGGEGKDLIDGGDGFDTADYMHEDSAVTVDLSLGKGLAGEALGDKLVSIEAVNGGYYNDTLSGDAGANKLDGENGADLLHGGAGADVLDGGKGSWGDTADYAGSEAVIINLTVGRGYLGDATGDTLIDIEHVNGSSFSDLLIGDAQGNVLKGGDGGDTLRGRGGQDTLDGGDGNDVLEGGGNYNVFVFKGSAWGTDEITDFGGHANHIDLSGQGYTFNDLKITYANGDALVATSHGSILLDDVTKVTSDMFVF